MAETARQALGFPPSGVDATFFESKIRSDPDQIWVAVDQKARIAGFILGGWLKPEPDNEIDLIEVWVEPRSATSNIADRLIERFVQAYRDKAFNRIWLTDTLGRSDGFWNRFGFRRYSRKSMKLELKNGPSTLNRSS